MKTKYKKYEWLPGRDRVSSVLFLTVICMTFFSLLNVFFLIYRVQEQKKAGEYRYESLYSISYPLRTKSDGQLDYSSPEELNQVCNDAKEGFANLLSSLQEFGESNVYWTSRYLSVGGEYQAYSVDLLLFCGEPIKDRTKRGISFDSLPSENEVYIGESLLSATYLKGQDRYIDLESVPCHVIDILENEMASGNDSRILIDYRSANDALKRELIDPFSMLQTLLDTHAFRIRITSDRSVLSGDKRLRELAEEYHLQITSIDEIKPVNPINEIYLVYEKMGLVLSLFFSFFSCLSGGYLWLSRRKKELLIRIVWGDDFGHLIRTLSFDILRFMGYGIIIGSGLFLFWNLIMGISCTWKAFLHMSVVLPVFGLYMLLLFVISLFMIRKLVMTIPSEGLSQV